MEPNNLSTTPGISQAMTDVRKSYRLLYEYQQRVLALVSFMANNLDYKWIRTNTRFCNPRKNYTKIKPDNSIWSWDFLLMYNLIFYFEPKESNRARDTILKIVLISDTGFYDSENKIQQTDVDHFSSPEKSKTQLHLIVKSNKNQKWTPYRESQFTSNSISNTFIKKDDSLNLDLVGMKFDLDALSNETAVRNALDSFVALCDANGFNIKKT